MRKSFKLQEFIIIKFFNSYTLKHIFIIKHGLHYLLMSQHVCHKLVFKVMD